MDYGYPGNVTVRIETTSAGTGANNVGRINLTDLKSGSAWSTIGNSKITGTLGNVQVTKVGGSGGGVDFSGGIAGFSGILLGPNSDTPAGTVSMTFSSPGSVSGTIKAESVTMTGVGNWSAAATCTSLSSTTVGGNLSGSITIGGGSSYNLTVTGSFTGSIAINDTMSGNITLNGTTNSGSITIGTMNGDISSPNAGLTGTVSIGTMNGDICATNLTSGDPTCARLSQMQFGSSGTVCGSSIPDCNANGYTDACDIASNRSHDFDSDGVPDECQCHAPPQDTDGDADVDLVDFSSFQNCFNGPNRPWKATDNVITCFCLDYDEDHDVDLADFARFQVCFNGPNRAPNCEEGGDSMNMAAAESSLASSSTSSGECGDYDVVFSLTSPQAGQTITAGTAVQWTVAVCVSGSNQGLAGYLCDLFLGPDDGPGPGLDGTWGTADDENLADITLAKAQWSTVYAVEGEKGKPTTGKNVTQDGGHGGPGMNSMPSIGYNDRAGCLLQMGTAYMDWDPWRPEAYYDEELQEWVVVWAGDQTWGVGLADRKDELLWNANGAYDLHKGSIDTTNLAPGHYVLTLVPGDLVTVLRSDVDLSVQAEGNVVTQATSVSGAVSIEFDIEEP